MCGMSLPGRRGAGHPAGCGGLADNNGDELACSVGSAGRVAVIVLDGELDTATATAPGLTERLAPLARTGKSLVLDLAGLRFCECAGLSLFLGLRCRARDAGGSLHPAAPPAAVRRLIAATRLGDALPVAASPAEVITALGGDAGLQRRPGLRAGPGFRMAVLRAWQHGRGHGR